MCVKKTKQNEPSNTNQKPMKVKYPTPFLKMRREMLGLDQQETANRIGVEWDTYRQWEHRGQIPDGNLSKIAEVLKVSELDLLNAKHKPLIAEVFEVDPDTLEMFLRRNSKR